jgi:hypothetical protein
MLRFTLTAGLLALAVSVCSAQSSTPTATTPSHQGTTTSAAPSGGPVIPVELAKSVDSKKLKQGDEVDAKTAAEMHGADGTVIPKGSKVVGHVTQSTARSNGNPDSTLAFNFDKIVLKDGKELPLKATIQAVAPPPALAGPGEPDSSHSSGNSGRGGTNAGLGSNDGRTPSGQLGAPASQLPGQSDAPRNSGNANAQPELTGQSVGVAGIHGLEMGQDSVLKSTGKNVKLETGTRMILRVQTQ